MTRFIDPGLGENCSLTSFLKNPDGEFSEKVEEVEVKPCKSDSGEYLIESNLAKRLGSVDLDEKTLEFVLGSNEDRFSNMKSSEELGVFDISWESHKIKVFSSGKIEVRQGTNREEMRKILRNIEKLVVVSFKCDDCNRVLLDCVSGKCSVCLGDLDGIELDGYFRPMVEKSLNSLLSTYNDLLESGFDLENLSKGDGVERFKPMLQESFRTSSSLIVNSTERNSLLAGWEIQSMIFDTFRVLECFDSFLERGISNEEMESILNNYLSINRRLALLYNGSEIDIQEVIEESLKFRDYLSEFRMDSDIKGVRKGFYFLDKIISGNFSRLEGLQEVYF